MLRSIILPIVLAALSLYSKDSVHALDQNLSGINYDLRQGPDWDPKKCKTPDTIASDLKIISTITSNVRTYSLSGCDVATVLKTSKSLGMTVWLGVWVSADTAVFEKELEALDALLKANLIDDNVIGFNVGSEAVYRKDITAKQAISYLNQFKKKLADVGLNTPVSITDIVDTFLQYPEMIKAGDVVTANQFPFWEGIPAEKAAKQMYGRLQPFLNLAAGKKVIISETGWPTSGISANASKTGFEEAAQFLNDFHIMATENNWDYYYFCAFDTPYKAEQLQEVLEESVEAHFGIFQADGTMKPSYESLTFKKSAGMKDLTSTSEGGSSVDSPASSTDTEDGLGAGTVHAGDSSSTPSDGTSDSPTKGSSSADTKTSAAIPALQSIALVGLSVLVMTILHM